MIKYTKDQFDCPVEATLALIGGKYKPLILWYLIDGPLHYMDLQRMIPKATPKMLSQQLHGLEECGLIHREVVPQKPPRTLYSLTPFGRSIIPVLTRCATGALISWTGRALRRAAAQKLPEDLNFYMHGHNEMLTDAQTDRGGTDTFTAGYRMQIIRSYPKRMTPQPAATGSSSIC